MTARTDDAPPVDASFIAGLFRISGDIILRAFRSGTAAEWKRDGSPVTAADRDAENALRDAIRRRFPAHGILGEEGGAERPDAEFVWVIDPIDGTKSFLAGVPLFGTLLALCRAGQPVLGAMHLPVQDDLIVGDAAGTTRNGTPVRVRPSPPVGSALILCTDPAAVRARRNAAGFDRLLSRTGTFRTWGDCFGYALLATGRADVMLDASMQAWDRMALIPIVRGAGGVITGWNGEDPVNADGIVAASPGLHGGVLEMLAGGT